MQKKRSRMSTSATRQDVAERKGCIYDCCIFIELSWTWIPTVFIQYTAAREPSERGDMDTTGTQ